MLVNRQVPQSVYHSRLQADEADIPRPSMFPLPKPHYTTLLTATIFFDMESYMLLLYITVNKKEVP